MPMLSKKSTQKYYSINPLLYRKLPEDNRNPVLEVKKWDITNVWMALLFGNVEHGLSFFHLQKYQNVLCYHF